MIALLGSQTVKEPLRSRLLFPLAERDFTYRRYDEWLARLDPARIVPLCELEEAESPVLGLRHDVDSRLESALELGRLEHERGIRATYFILHTAPYYRQDGALLEVLRRLQDGYGHELGWHNDLVTLQRVEGIDAGDYLEGELEWLRGNGIRVRGSAAHGSPWCHRLGFHNNYVFSGWDEPVPGFPSTEVPQKLDPADFGLEYEAYHLSYDTYWSDSSFSAGRRSHPDSFRLGERTVVLVHPCHWDRSVAAKARRLADKVGARLA